MFGPVLLWAIFALLTAAAVLAVLWPLTRRTRPATGDGDQMVYVDQMDEIERSRADGTLTPAEADAARAEVGRRLLVAARREHESAEPAVGSRVVRIVATVCILCIPLGAVAVYASLGAPSVPDAPRSARLDGGIEGQSIGTLLARVEDHLTKNPNDVRGWAAVAPIYLRVGRGEDAANAYRTLIGLQGPTSDNETGLGEALALSAGGVVTADARAAFEKAVELDPTNVKPRFYLALALSQEGRTDEAKAAWDAIIASAKGDEPWLEVAKVERARLDPGAAPMAGAGLPGPSSEDVKAAAGMSSGDRQAMIAGMVSRLAERLATDGGTPDEWARLVRAQLVMGRADDARATLAKARAAFPGDAAAQETLDAVADGLEAAPSGAVAPLPGPSSEDVKAAAGMSSGDRQAMIAGMVSRLAERLATDGGTPDEWARLVRAQLVMGRADDARATLAKARAAFPGDAAAQATLDAAAGGLEPAAGAARP